MKVGLALSGLYFSGAPARMYAILARTAEDLGFESVWLGDHLIFPTVIPSTYPYNQAERSPHRPNMHRMDPFLTFSHLSAVTERIRFGTNVYLLPLRDPFVTARALTTLDVLSGGRAILGVGVGWLKEEFNIVGETFENRGRRTDEIVEILKRLWTEDTIEFRGRYYSFGPVNFEPKPVQRPHPPILFGGISPAMMRRAATLGDGWIAAPNPETGSSHSPEEISSLIKELQSLRRAAGREGQPFEITTGVSAATVEDLKRYEDVGVHRVTVSPWTQEPRMQTIPDDEIADQHFVDAMERFAERVLSKIEG